MVLILAVFTNFHGFITGDPGLVTDLQQFKLLAHNWRLNWRHLFLSEADYHLSLVKGKPNKHTPSTQTNGFPWDKSKCELAYTNFCIYCWVGAHTGTVAME